MFSISSSTLTAISPHANPILVPELAAHLPAAMEKFEITTLERAAMFLGQCAEESAGYRTLTEYASGHEYEGRHDLGNVYAGDGVRYKGRGLIMLTGRYNHKLYGEKLGVDFVGRPELAQQPEYAALTACQFWHDHGLNAFADADDIRSITHRVNGGYNGLSDRILYTDRAKHALAGVLS